MMGAIGTGNVVPGAVTASFGTSGTIYAFSRKPVVDPSGEIAAFCSSTGGWLPLLCTMNVTGVTEQVRALFGWSLADLRARRGRRAGGIGRSHASPLPGRRAHPQPSEGHGRLLRARPQDACAGAPRAGRDRGDDARDELRASQALRALGVRPREIRLTGGGARSATLAPGRRGRLRGSGCRDGAGRERRRWAAPSRPRGATRPAAAQARRSRSSAARSVSVDESTRCSPDREAGGPLQAAPATSRTGSVPTSGRIRGALTG